MSDCLPTTNIDLTLLDATDLFELKLLAAESMGWQPLGQGAYLHHGAKENPEEQVVIEVVGMPESALAGLNALLLF